jgi:oligogalacturonide transporter
MIEEKPVKRHDRLAHKLVFASADILGGGSFNIINFLYPGFLALTLGLNAFWVAFVILAARIWDAVIDPLIGYLSDRTKSRWGKRRVYMIFSSPLLLVGFYFLFFPYNFDQLSLRIVAALVSYLVFITIQSTAMVPYYSLSSEISSDYEKRGSFNAVRLGFSIFASILCVAIPPLLIDSFSDSRVGFQVMAVSFGMLFFITTLITGLFAKEEIVTPIVKEKFSVKALIRPLKIKSYRQYLYLFLVVQMAMAIMSGLFFFYIDFYILRDTTMAMESSMVGLIAAALMFSMQIVALPFFMWIMKKRGKSAVYRIGAVIWIIAGLGLFFIPMNANPILIYLLGAVMGFGISGPGLAPHAMFGDVVDAGQLIMGERLDGQMGGFTNFVNQISQAIGIALAMFIIGLAGFIENDLTTAGGVYEQPFSALWAIRIIMAFTPLVLMTIGILVSYTYKITAKRQTQMIEAIENQQPLDVSDL